MSSPVPRLRMFAGPNGSGKSTIKAEVDEGLWGHFVNADNIEALLKRLRWFNFEGWDISPSADETRAFFENHWIQNRRSTWLQEVQAMQFGEGKNQRRRPAA